MHDLRQKVLLQSGKTVSRKHRAHAESSRTSSVNHTPNTSPGGSRVNSRPGSRHGSEDEDGSGSDYDDVMTMRWVNLEAAYNFEGIWADLRASLVRIRLPTMEPTITVLASMSPLGRIACVIALPTYWTASAAVSRDGKAQCEPMSISYDTITPDK